MSKLIPDIPEIKEDHRHEEMSNAEAKDISEERLDKTARKNDHERKENTKDVVHHWTKCIFITLNAGVVCGIITLFFHWLLPKECWFLTAEQLETIKIIFFSALATNFAKDFYRKSI